MRGSVLRSRALSPQEGGVKTEESAGAKAKKHSLNPDHMALCSLERPRLCFRLSGVTPPHAPSVSIPQDSPSSGDTLSLWDCPNSSCLAQLGRQKSTEVGAPISGQSSLSWLLSWGREAEVTLTTPEPA